MPVYQGSTIDWVNGASGDWTNASNWVGGVVPSSGSDVVIDNSTGDNSRVNGDSPITIGSLTIDAASGSYIGADFNDLTVTGAISMTGPTDGNGQATFSVTRGTVSAAEIDAVSSGIGLNQGTIDAASITTYGFSIDSFGASGTSEVNGNVTAELVQLYGYEHAVVNGNLLGFSTNLDGNNAFIANEVYVLMSGGATLEVNGSLDAHVTMADTNANNAPTSGTTLTLDKPAAFTGYVTVSDGLDRVDVVGIAPGALTRTAVSGSAVGITGLGNDHGVAITGTDGSGHAISFDMFGWYTNSSATSFRAVISSDGNGGSFVSLAPASSASWVNDASGDWYSAASWVGGAVPGSTADVTITNDGTGDMRIGASAAVTANSLTINPDTFGGIVEATFSANLTLAGALTLETGDRRGAGVYFTQDGGTLSAQSISAHYTGMNVNNGTIIAPTMLQGSLSFSGTTAKAVGNVTADVIEAGTGTSAVIDGSLAGYTDSSVPGEAYAYITNGATLEITGSAAVHATLDDIGVQYKPASGTTLKLDKASGFTGYVVMTDVYDRVDVVGIAPGSLRATAVDGSSIGITGLYNNYHGVDVTGVDGSGNPVSLDLFGWNTGVSTTTFNAVITSDGHGGSYVSLVPANLVTVAANTAILVQANKQYQGGGNDQFYVTPTTIADTIDGGGNNSSLGVLDGAGPSVMGSNITGFGQVHLMGGFQGAAGYTFTANATQGLVIVGSQGNDVITVGDASQTVFTYGQSSVVKATAATAGVKVQAITNTATLEITGGGSATLNANDGHGLIVQIDQATVLNMGLTAFISAIAETAGSTVTAGAPFQTLVTMAGGTTFIGATARNTYADTLKGTSAGLNGDTFVNFGKSDAIDITDVLPASSIVYTQTSSSQGTLAFGGSSVALQGVFNPAKFQMVTDGGSGTLVKYLG